jgi:DNA-binding NarL/FixJ family response regulator
LPNTVDTLSNIRPQSTLVKRATVRGKPRTAQSRRFALFDAQPLRGECFACWLRVRSPRSVVFTFQHIDDLVSCLGTGDGFDIIIFNICESAFPQADGALDKFMSMSLSVPTVVISNERNPGAVLEWLRRGARGFIPTSLDACSASSVLDFVATGGTFLPAPLFLEADLAPLQQYAGGGKSVANLDGPISVKEAVTNIALPGSGAPLERATLTTRETLVLEWICRGKPNKLIAYELGVCESTVKMYVGRLMRKVKVTNRTELALFGERLRENSGSRDDGLSAEPPSVSF